MVYTVASIVLFVTTAKDIPFQVKYIPFGGRYYMHFTKELIQAKGYDISSLLKPRKSEVLKVLTLSRPNGNVAAGSLRLFIKSGTDVWLVDSVGNATLNGKSRRLSREDFFELKKIIIASLPLNDLGNAGLSKREQGSAKFKKL